MSQEPTLSADGSYAVLTVREEMTNEVGVANARALRQCADRHGVSRFLVDVRGWPYAGTVFTHYDFVNRDLREEQFDRTWRVAVIASPDDETHDFLEAVCVNAGYNIRVFKNYAEGVEWLAGRAAAGWEIEARFLSLSR